MSTTGRGKMRFWRSPAIKFTAISERSQSPCGSLAWYHHDLPALRLRFNVEILKTNVQSCALWNRNHIETVRVIWIVVWISRTFQSVAYNLATSYQNKVALVSTPLFNDEHKYKILSSLLHWRALIKILSPNGRLRELRPHYFIYYYYYYYYYYY